MPDSSPHSSPGEIEAANEYERKINWVMADRVENIRRWLPTDDISTARRDLADLVEQYQAALDFIEANLGHVARAHVESNPPSAPAGAVTPPDVDQGAAVAPRVSGAEPDWQGMAEGSAPASGYDGLVEAPKAASDVCHNEAQSPASRLENEA